MSGCGAVLLGERTGARRRPASVFVGVDGHEVARRTRGDCRVAGELGRHDLQGDVTGVAAVPRPEHRAHPADAQQLEQLQVGELGGQLRDGRRALVVDAAGRADDLLAGLQQHLTEIE